MKKHLLLPILALAMSGCAINRPKFTETYDPATGHVISRELVVPSWVFWPATQTLEKQRASLGKTFSLGTTGMEQESGGTNFVEALRELNSLVGKIRP